MDAGYNPVPLPPGQLSWSLDTPIGTIDANGHFVATSPGTGQAVATAAGVTGSAPITVLSDTSAPVSKPPQLSLPRPAGRNRQWRARHRRLGCGDRRGIGRRLLRAPAQRRRPRMDHHAQGLAGCPDRVAHARLATGPTGSRFEPSTGPATSARGAGRRLPRERGPGVVAIRVVRSRDRGAGRPRRRTTVTGRDRPARWRGSRASPSPAAPSPGSPPRVRCAAAARGLRSTRTVAGNVDTFRRHRPRA